MKEFLWTNHSAMTLSVRVDYIRTEITDGTQQCILYYALSYVGINFLSDKHTGVSGFFKNNIINFVLFTLCTGFMIILHKITHFKCNKFTGMKYIYEETGS